MTKQSVTAHSDSDNVSVHNCNEFQEDVVAADEAISDHLRHFKPKGS